MPRIRQIKTNFTAGEISPRLLGRGDLVAYQNGASRLRNVFVFPTGGVSRRPGLRHVAIAPGAGRLISFEFNSEQTYLLVLSDRKIDFYQNDILLQQLTSPWPDSLLKQLVWTQSADTLLLCHPDIPPQKITRDIAGKFRIQSWRYHQKGNITQQPFYRFAPPEVTLRSSRTAGKVKIYASAPVLDSRQKGDLIRIGGKQILLGKILNDGMTADGTALERLRDTNPTVDWDEQAFSTLHGWPVSCVFHQDRLVIGGSRDLPNRLWLSRSGDLFNFDLAGGEDDAAIEFAILSDQVNAIRAVFSARHLQIFTSGAEWMVTGDPLSPANIQLKRQTRVGAPTDRYVPPIDVDGATLYVSRTGKEIREFLFTDVEQAYRSDDLALLAQHLVHAPKDMAFDQQRRILFVVMNDGSLASATLFRPEKINAWSLQETNGDFISVCVVGDKVYFLIRRGDGPKGYRIECFDTSFNTDAARHFSLSGAGRQGEIEGFNHLAGDKVQVVADDIVREDHIISAEGKLTLLHPADSIEAGLAYTHEITPLPVYHPGPVSAGPGMPVRLVRVIFRLLNTRALEVNTGQGTSPVPFKRFARQGALDSPIEPFTGDKTIRALGWQRGDPNPLWMIEQDQPLPCTVLSILSEISSPSQ